jgi:hypothetical protein
MVTASSGYVSVEPATDFIGRMGAYAQLPVPALFAEVGDSSNGQAGDTLEAGSTGGGS